MGASGWCWPTVMGVGVVSTLAGFVLALYSAFITDEDAAAAALRTGMLSAGVGVAVLCVGWYFRAHWVTDVTGSAGDAYVSMEHGKGGAQGVGKDARASLGDTWTLQDAAVLLRKGSTEAAKKQGGGHDVENPAPPGKPADAPPRRNPLKHEDDGRAAGAPRSPCATQDEVTSYFEHHSDADFIPPSCSSYIGSHRGSLALPPQPVVVIENLTRSPHPSVLQPERRTPPCIGTNPKSSWAASDTDIESRGFDDSVASTPVGGRPAASTLPAVRTIASGTARSPAAERRLSATGADLRSPLSLVNALCPSEASTTGDGHPAGRSLHGNNRRRSSVRSARRAAACNKEQGFEFTF
eukprot:TRINITY_DN27840_c0_g1_i1.p1 TRINITY_DN27840_c0_g1~~TRINITY_DN27840_c0_g1_i1.p1  ORF type:complete len:353 (+),score=91.37 TRINITY_DN27840_c0_g1_i1:57-1115(+)